MKIGEIVKKYREEHGLSMRQFAKLTGLSHAYIPLIERGTNHNGEPLIPSITAYKQIADAMGLSLHELVKMVDEDERVDISSAGNNNEAPDLPAYSLNLKHYRIAHGLSTADAASRSEVATRQWIAWERGNEVPTEEELIRAAKTLRVTPRKLLEKKEEPEETETIPGIYPVRKKSFPVLGKVACGEPIFAEEDHETSIMASADIDADFCLIAQGDSMTGAHIEDGDIVFIRQMEVVPNGKIAVVLIEDEATLKYIEYRPEQATLILTPANPAFRTQIYTGEELNQIRVLGMAVTLQKDLTRR